MFGVLDKTVPAWWPFTNPYWEEDSVPNDFSKKPLSIGKLKNPHGFCKPQIPIASTITIKKHIFCFIPLYWVEECPSKIRVHLVRQNEPLFGKRVFPNGIS